MEQTGMVWDRELAGVFPNVDRGTVGFGDMELAMKPGDNFKVMEHIRDGDGDAFTEVINDDALVGEDEDESGGEALAPGVFGHEANQRLGSCAREDVQLRIRDDNLYIIRAAVVAVGMAVVEAGQTADHFVFVFVHERAQFVGGYV